MELRAGFNPSIFRRKDHRRAFTGPEQTSIEAWLQLMGNPRSFSRRSNPARPLFLCWGGASNPFLAPPARWLCSACLVVGTRYALRFKWLPRTRSPVHEAGADPLCPGAAFACLMGWSAHGTLGVFLGRVEIFRWTLVKSGARAL